MSIVSMDLRLLPVKNPPGLPGWVSLLTSREIFKKDRTSQMEVE